MRKLIIFLLTVMIVLFSACSQNKQDKPYEKNNFVLVKGGCFKNTKSNYYGKSIKIKNFYIGKYEVTQKEWINVMGSNPSKFKDNKLPVETVSWYDCIEYCNERSKKENLEPYYTIKDDISWTITLNSDANGYRLPTEKEWEYASSGGQISKSYTYSGSNNIDEVAWFWINSGDKPLSGFWSLSAVKNNKNKTKPIGTKKPNELGIYDMSGNVREWCWDTELKSSNNSVRIWKGGGWLGDERCCEISFHDNWSANQKGDDTGLRVCRNK